MPYKRGVRSRNASQSVPAARGVWGYKGIAADADGDLPRVDAPIPVGIVDGTPDVLRKLKPDGEVVNLGGGSSAVQSVTVDLSTAQIAALGTSPVEVVAAPGAGKVLVPTALFFDYKYGTQRFGHDRAIGIDPIDTTASTIPFHSQTNSRVLASSLGTDGSQPRSNVVNQPLNLTAVAPVEYAGPILTSSLGSAPGTGYQVGDTGTIVGGNGVGAYAVDSVVTTGQVLTASLNAGGSAYAGGDVVLGNGGNADQIITVDTVDGGGAVLTFTVNTPGSGYAVANGVTTTALSGVGTGFKINIDSVAPLGAVVTYHLTANGNGYPVTVDAEATPLTGTGMGLLLNIDTITANSDGTARLTVLYYVMELA